MTSAKGQSIGSTGDTELRRQEEAAARTAAKCERAHLRATQAPVSMGRSRASLKRKRKRQQKQTNGAAIAVPAQQQPSQVPAAPAARSPPLQPSVPGARGLSCTSTADPQDDGNRGPSSAAAHTNSAHVQKKGKLKKKKAKTKGGGGGFAELEELNAMSEKIFLSSLLKPVDGAGEREGRGNGSAKLLENEARAQYKGREQNQQSESRSTKKKQGVAAVAATVEAEAEAGAPPISRAAATKNNTPPIAGSSKRTKTATLPAKGAGGARKRGTGATGGGATSRTTVSTGVRHLGGGLFVRDLASGGHARRVAEGDTVQLTYVGRLSGSNKKFDRCSNPNKPFRFVVGAGEVVTGMDLGVRGMGKGGRRVITIPPRLGYGARSQPGIPGNSTLLFDVTVVRIGL